MILRSSPIATAALGNRPVSFVFVIQIITLFTLSLCVLTDPSTDTVPPSVAAVGSSITEGIHDIDTLLQQFRYWFEDQGGKLSSSLYFHSKPPLCPLGILDNYIDNDSVAKARWWSKLGASATGITGGSNIRGSSEPSSAFVSSKSAKFIPRRRTASTTTVSSLTPYRGDIQIRNKYRVPKETVLIGVPHHLLLLPASLETCTLCNPSERLVLRLVEEYNKGTDSLWYPYIILLPNYVPTAVIYTNEDMDILYNTYAGGIISSVQRTFKKFLYKIKTSVRNKYNDNILRWAFTIVQSRAFTVGSSSSIASGSSNSSSSSTPTSVQALYGIPFLAPGADFFNHKPSSKIGWNLQLTSNTVPIDKQQQQQQRNQIKDPDSGSVSSPSSSSSLRYFGIVTLEPYNTMNTEIYNNYHDTATNAHLLAQYGFIYGDNNNDYDRLWSSSSFLSANKPTFFNRYDGVVITLPLPATVYDNFAHVRKDLIAHVRQLVDRQQATEKDVDFVAKLLPYSTPTDPTNHPAESLLSLPSNVSIILHGQGTGPLPNILLNLARLTALALPSTTSWLDAHGTIVYGTGTTGGSLSPKFLPLQYLHSHTPLHNHEDMKNAVIIPRSATEELERVGESLKERILSLTRQSMDRLIGTEPSRKLVPVSRNSMVNTTSFVQTRESSTDQRVEVNSDGSVQLNENKDYVSSTISVGYLLDGHLNTSVLTEILAMRILKKSIEKLIENYPSSYKEGEQLYQQIQAQLYDVVQNCRGIRKTVSSVNGSTTINRKTESETSRPSTSILDKQSTGSGTISSHVTNNKDGNKGRAAAIAAATGSLTGTKRKTNPYFDPRYLTEKDIDELDPNELVTMVQKYQRQSMMIQCRLTEQTILQSALQQVNHRLQWAQRIIFPDTDITSTDDDDDETPPTETIDSKRKWKWSKDSTHPHQQQEQRTTASAELDTPSGTLPVSFTDRHTHEEIDTSTEDDATHGDEHEETERRINKQPTHQHGHSAYEVLHDI